MAKKADEKAEKGPLVEIVVAVVVALLVGGTAPWWWPYVWLWGVPKGPPPPITVPAPGI